MPTKISIFFFSTFSKSILVDIFFFKVSLENISTFLFGYIFFNSEKILSTPGPQNNRSHFLSSLHILDNKDLWPQWWQSNLFNLLWKFKFTVQLGHWNLYPHFLQTTNGA